jgi:hypothetical protein
MQTFSINELSIALTSTTANILAGAPIQYFGRAGVLTIYGCSDAVGITHALTVNDGQTNTQVIPTTSGLGACSTTGTVKTNEAFIGQYAIPAGVQLIHSVTNTTAGAVKVNFIYVIT